MTGYGLAMRAGALLEALAFHGAVSLLVIPVYDPYNTTLPASVQPFCCHYRLLTISRWRRWLAPLTDRARGRRFQATYPDEYRFVSARLLREVDDAFPAVRFAYLYVFRLYMAPFVRSYFTHPSLQGCYLDLDDVESVTRQRLSELYGANGLHAKARREHQSARRYVALERAWLPKFDGISVCSQQDRRYIKPLAPNRDIIVLPNVVRLPTVSRLTRHDGPFNMLFVGNLTYYPNCDALAFFIDEVLPLLRLQASRPLWLTIIGAGGWKGWRQYQHVAECRYLGFVPDVGPYYRQADAMVVPLRAGGGTRIKVLEAFSFKCPVISTSLGVEGIEVVHDTHVLIADQPQHFATQCCRLMADPQLATALATRAYACLAHHYTPAVLQRRLAQLIA